VRRPIKPTKRSDMNRRFVLSGALAGSAMAVLVAPAAGSASWCEDDPLVVIKTPTGKQLPLHVTNYAEGSENQTYLTRVPDNQEISNPWIGWTVAQSKRGLKRPIGTPATAVLWDVTISVTIHTDPGDGKRFRTRTIASSQEFGGGIKYAERYGNANRTMELRFSIWA
jgi:hypothetical protein